MKILLASVIALSSVTPVFAEYQRGYSQSRTCLKTEYREEYVPGTRENPGYIKTYNETIEVPCDRSLTEGQVIRETTIQYDNNDCTDGKVAGAILGGGVGAALSRDDGRWWAIPLGIVTGSAIGCDLDGG
tara:strand:- start:140 stop:529 length:390 start_codon:yes stop_codon:yes gene_type:complete